MWLPKVDLWRSWSSSNSGYQCTSVGDSQVTTTLTTPQKKVMKHAPSQGELDQSRGNMRIYNWGIYMDIYLLDHELPAIFGCFKLDCMMYVWKILKDFPCNVDAAGFSRPCMELCQLDVFFDDRCKDGDRRISIGNSIKDWPTCWSCQEVLQRKNGTSTFKGVPIKP